MPYNRKGPTGGGRGGWFVCNRSDEPVLYFAINVHNGATWEKSGWYDIPQGKCVTVRSSITTRFAYYFAQGGSRTFSGNNIFCADKVRPFVHAGDGCPEGYDLVGFRRVEFGGGSTFTLNLR